MENKGYVKTENDEESLTDGKDGITEKGPFIKNDSKSRKENKLSQDSGECLGNDTQNIVGKEDENHVRRKVSKRCSRTSESSRKCSAKDKQGSNNTTDDTSAVTANISGNMEEETATRDNDANLQRKTSIEQNKEHIYARDIIQSFGGIVETNSNALDKGKFNAISKTNAEKSQCYTDLLDGYVDKGRVSDEVSKTCRYRNSDGVILRASDLKKKTSNADEAVDNEALLDETQANGDTKVHVERALYSQKEFDESYEPGHRPSPSLGDVMRKKVSKCVCSGKCVKDFLIGMFPFIDIMKNYNVRADLMGDVVSGLTVGIMHIPQGMAYGMLTTLPPVYGLYMSFFPVLIYFFFGSSKHISIGTFAVACLMIGSSVSKGFDKLAPSLGIPTTGMSEGGNSSEAESNNTGTLVPSGGEEAEMSQEELTIRLQYAMSVTFLVGVIQMLMGICRLGFITVYLSDPLISGFTTGAACHVFTSQIKHVFGIKTARYSGAFKLIYTYAEFFKDIPKTNSITLITSILCIVMLYSVSRFINQNPKLKPKMLMPVPIELIVVVLGTLISYLVNLEGRYNVVIVNDIPTGLPVPNLYAFSRVGDVVSDAIALAIVIFAISISMGKLLAKKHEYEVDANQELIAFGISTIFSSFFSSGAPSASLSRSLIQERVGGKTQLAGVVSCALLLVVLLAIGPYFRTLPNCILGASIIVALEGLFRQVFDLPEIWRTSKSEFCVLASIIIVALRGMFLQVLDLKKLWSVSIIDFTVWIVAFLATVVLDVDLGLGVAVIFAILTVVCRSQRPYACLLGQMQGTDIYRDISVYPMAEEIAGLKIFRFEQSLFFVNTEHFRATLYKKTINPRDLKIMQKKRQAREENMLKRKQSKEEKLPLKKSKKPRAEVKENGQQAEAVQENGQQTGIEIATGISTPNISIRHDVMNIEVHVSGLDISVPDKPECPPDLEFHTIIIDCSSWSFVDSMAVKVLTSVIGEYSGIGVKVCLCNCKSGIRDMFTKTGFYDTLDHSRIYVSIHDAVVGTLHLESPRASAVVPPKQPLLKELPMPKVNFMDEGSDRGRRRVGSSLSSDDEC